MRRQLRGPGAIGHSRGWQVAIGSGFSLSIWLLPLVGDVALDEVEQVSFAAAFGGHQRRIGGEGALGLGHPSKLPVEGLYGVRGVDDPADQRTIVEHQGQIVPAATPGGDGFWVLLTLLLFQAIERVLGLLAVVAV